MATTTTISWRAYTNVIFFLCLGVATCEAKLKAARGAPGTVVRHAGRKEADIARSISPAYSKRDPTEKIFNILDFGAKPGGKIDNTMALQLALATACHEWKGRARVIVPRGVFLIGEIALPGPCLGPPPFIVQIQGTLKAIPDISMYPGDSWVLFEYMNGLVVTGGGTFDGQGGAQWESVCKQNCEQTQQQLPVSIKLNHVSNAIIRGINSINSMGFHLGIVLCENVRAYNIHLTAPRDSPNTDGVHISQSRLIKVARSVIATGDDCISVIRDSTDVSIKKVTCGPGHGISIGSLGKYEDEHLTRGVIVKNCTFLNTDNGVRIKTKAGPIGSLASGFTFQDLVMKNVRNPIIIDQNYQSSKGQSSLVKISDVNFINIRGTTSSFFGVNLLCSRRNPCQNVHLANIDLHYAGPQRALRLASSCTNAKVVYAGMQNPPPCR